MSILAGDIQRGVEDNWWICVCNLWVKSEGLLYDVEWFGWKYEIWRSGKEFWVRVVCGVFMMRQVGILVAHLTSGWIRRLERTYSRRGGVEFPELLLKSAHYAWM